jgi:hypothetical protein
MRLFFPRWLECARGVTLALQLAAGGCESSAPASTSPPGRAPSVAHEWTGSRATPIVAPAVQDPSVPKGTWVLHIGDSFVHASFQQNLRPRFEGAKTTYFVDAKTATYTTTWANDPKLDHWLERRPSLVLVTLGANEVEMPAPGEHARAIEQLVRKIGAASTSCVWITPPMWKADTGILRVIHDHASPCLFFDSDGVLGGLKSDERQGDRIHPNRRGGERWTNAFWGWLVDHKDGSRPGWALVPFEVRSP